MDSIEKKLKKFSELVLEKANTRKEERIALLEKEKEEKLDAYEIVLLKKAYKEIHDAIDNQDHEQSEIISNALLESRKTLFMKRKEISKSLFKKVKDELLKFRETNEYKDYLFEKISLCLKNIGDDEAIITFMQKDIEIIDEIRNKLKSSFVSVFSNDDIIGGFSIVSNKKKLSIDFTFITMIEDVKEKFFTFSELNID